MDRPFPAYKGDEPYIFVSYSHKDAPAVFPELTRLRGEGFNIWFDEGIEAGTEWREEIGKAILSAGVFCISYLKKLFYPRIVAKKLAWLISNRYLLLLFISNTLSYLRAWI